MVAEKSRKGFLLPPFLAGDEVDDIPALEALSLELVELPAAAAPLSPSTQSSRSSSYSNFVRRVANKFGEEDGRDRSFPSSPSRSRQSSNSSQGCLSPSRRNDRRRREQAFVCRLLPPKGDGKAIHPCSPLLVARPGLAVQKHSDCWNRRHSVCRAALIRANACRFADRYCIREETPLVGEGTFGRVHQCVDKLADLNRAVKRLKLPKEGALEKELVNEIDALIALDHPAIVRLIEYFVEGSELLLVMELLQGPSLGEKLRDLGIFPEDLAVRCLRHMLKALFCCHCHGIAHNDVSQENFRFESTAPEAALKMVDFGLSEMSSEDSRGGRAIYVEKRDIWSVGTILYEMLTGQQLFPSEHEEESELSGSLAHLPRATNPLYVPSKLDAIQACPEARDLLHLMLEARTEERISAQEALRHPLLLSSYAPLKCGCTVTAPHPNCSFGGSCSSTHGTRPLRRTNTKSMLADCVPALRVFGKAKRLPRLALLVAAHLLSDSKSAKLDDMRWIFRYLAQDGWKIEERRFREVLNECCEEVPEDFTQLFEAADCSGSGALDFLEFMAAAISGLPDVYCQPSSLKAVFHFFDSMGSGVIRAADLHTIFPARSVSEFSAMLAECTQKDEMTFDDFKQIMIPEGWQEPRCLVACEAASWADGSSPAVSPRSRKVVTCAAPLTMEVASEQYEVKLKAVSTKVTSAPSEAFAIRQEPGFHCSTLRPYYKHQPVSNVVIGVVEGTSGYARRAFELGLAQVVESEGGIFFFMPNPKYHWTPETAQNAERKARFVAWWIHPELCDSLRAWTKSAPSTSRTSSPTLGPQGSPFDACVDNGVGAPGDFGYSNVAKPDGYLHTCRDLSGPGHLRMLGDLVGGIKRYLTRMFGESLSLQHVSAGFHYPVRPQYSTLHLQIRVNTGDVCPGEGRGVDLFRLLHRLSADPECLRRDEETLFYEATANLRKALLVASEKAQSSVQEVGPMSLVLGGPVSGGPLMKGSSTPPS